MARAVQAARVVAEVRAAATVAVVVATAAVVTAVTTVLVEAWWVGVVKAALFTVVAVDCSNFFSIMHSKNTKHYWTAKSML